MLKSPNHVGSIIPQKWVRDAKIIKNSSDIDITIDVFTFFRMSVKTIYINLRINLKLIFTI